MRMAGSSSRTSAVVGRPAPRLREQHEEERRRVDAAVVAREPDLGGAPAAQLVDDLARLRIDAGIVVLGLQLGQHAQGGVRELGPEDEGLQACDHGVAPEHRHEPRHARRGQQAHAVAAAHAQRREIRDGARVGLASSGHEARSCGTCMFQALERALDARPLLAEVTGAGRAPGPCAPGDRARNVSRTSHSACGPSSSANAERRPRDECGPRATHLGREHALGVEQVRGLGRRPGEQFDGRRQRLGEAGVAEREVVVLDREDVREVDAELDGQLDRHGVAGEVGDDDVLLQIVGHEALAADQQLVRAEPTGDRDCAGRTRPRSTRPCRPRAASAALR